MKIAVLGDIHANLEAMHAVLADVDSQKPDRILTVGDITGYGPNPCECIALARDRDITMVEGNHDHYIAGQGSLEENFHPSAIAMIYWQRGALSSDDKKFLGALPREYSLGDVKVVHTLPVGGEEWSYIFDAEQAGEAFKLNKGRIVFCGHSHVPMAFFDENPIVYVKETSFAIPVGVGALINVGAVGQPRDGDPRASWCLYDTEKRTVKIRRCAYDHRRTADKILKAGLPEKCAARLSIGR